VRIKDEFGKQVGYSRQAANQGCEPKEVRTVKQQLNPVVFWVVLGVVAVAVILVGYRMFGPSRFKAETTGSEQAMQRVQRGEKFYQPPTNAPIPGNPGYVPTGGTGPMMGGSSGGQSGPYNLTPPPR